MVPQVASRDSDAGLLIDPRHRESLVSALLRPQERAILRNEELPDDDLAIFAEAHGMGVPEFRRHCDARRMVSHLYKALNESSGWSYPRYLDLVTRSALHYHLSDLLGRPAVYYVGLCGSFRDFVALLDAGAAVDAQDHEGETILHALSRLPSRGKWLQEALGHSNDPGRRSDKGRTALDIAALEGNYPAVIALLDLGLTFDRHATLLPTVVESIVNDRHCPATVRSALAGSTA